MRKIFITTALFVSSIMVQAQVGTGWSSWSPTYNEQEVGTGNCNGSTFSITSTSTSTRTTCRTPLSNF